MHRARTVIGAGVGKLIKPLTRTAQAAKEGGAKVGQAAKEGGVKVGQAVKDGGVKVGRTVKEGGAKVGRTAKVRWDKATQETIVVSPQGVAVAVRGRFNKASRASSAVGRHAAAKWGEAPGGMERPTATERSGAQSGVGRPTATERSGAQSIGLVGMPTTELLGDGDGKDRFYKIYRVAAGVGLTVGIVGLACVALPALGIIGAKAVAAPVATTSIQGSAIASWLSTASVIHVAGAAGVGVVAVVAAPYVLSSLGFGVAGVKLGSLAAYLQGPAVAKGSLFALSQSAGALGLSTATLAKIGGAASVGAQTILFFV